MQTQDPQFPRYVLVTPARDEADYIRKTLESIVVQTRLPLKWVIVSDGSTDGTEEIVEEYAARHEWIELVRMPARKERNFGGKVHAFNAGYARVRDLEYQVIGNLDGDSSFEPDYIEYLLGKFVQNPRLGIAGTNYVEHSWENSLKQDYRFASIEDVTGQCQLFRREAFEAIGGYQPSRHGGIDLIATVRARMLGWETRVFTDKVLIHHRQQGTAQFNRFLVELSNGRKDYLYGNHPLYEACRAAYRLTKKPILLGGSLLFVGYFYALLTRKEKVVSVEFTRFRRNEQMARLRKLFLGFCGIR
jgi:poly-beta-1,6-N-acetyl-D-glucosamine synthase